MAHFWSMPTRSSKEHDLTTVAKRVVEQTIGEQWDGSPLPDKDTGKNPAAVALGRLGGAKGGRAGRNPSRLRGKVKLLRLPRGRGWVGVGEGDVAMPGAERPSTYRHLLEEVQRGHVFSRS